MRLVIFVLLLLLSTSSSLAFEDNIGYSKITPESPVYFLKTVRENLELKFALTTRVRNLRQLEFATRRLREAKTLIPINQDLIPPTLERYASHLNTIPDKDLNNQELSNGIKQALSMHLLVLQQIYPGANLRSRMFIRSAMNRIIQRADVPTFAKAPVCAFFSKEASSSALNQTEQSVLGDRAKKCFQAVTSL